MGILAGVVAAVAVSGAQTGSGFVVPGIPAGAGPVAHVLHAAGVALIKATQVGSEVVGELMKVDAALRPMITF